MESQIKKCSLSLTIVQEELVEKVEDISPNVEWNMAHLKILIKRHDIWRAGAQDAMSI